MDDDLIDREATISHVDPDTPDWIVTLDDGTVCAIPMIIDAPAAGTKITITSERYMLPPAIDPDQVERLRTVRIKIGDARIRVAEFDALIAERDRLRDALKALRGQGQPQPQPQPAEPPSLRGTIADRLRAALAALVQPTQQQPRTPGPFPGGVPPWGPGVPRMPQWPGPPDNADQ